VLLEGDPGGTATRTGLMAALLGKGAATQADAPGWWGWPANGRPGNGQPGAGRPGNGQPRNQRPGDGRPGNAEPGDGRSPGGQSGNGQPSDERSGAGQSGAGRPGGERPGAGQPDGAADAGQAGTLIRIGFWAAGLPQILRAVDAAALGAGLDPAIGGSAAAGVMYAAVGPDADPAAVAAFVSGLREALARGDGDARPASAPVPDGPPVLASAVVVHAPPKAGDLMDLWGPVPSLSLMCAVKDQFDPGHRMAPGRFAGGI